jgi:hypothetical protein
VPSCSASASTSMGVPGGSRPPRSTRGTTYSAWRVCLPAGAGRRPRSGGRCPGGGRWPGLTMWPGGGGRWRWIGAGRLRWPACGRLSSVASFISDLRRLLQRSRLLRPRPSPGRWEARRGGWRRGLAEGALDAPGRLRGAGRLPLNRFRQPFGSRGWSVRVTALSIPVRPVPR